MSNLPHGVTDLLESSSVLLSLLPATAAVVGAIILGQVPTAVEACGIALVVVASSLRSHSEPESVVET